MAKQNKRRQRPRGYWQDWSNLEQEMKEVIAGLGRFPTKSKLEATGRSNLIQASKHHGGLIVVREKMGYECSRKPSGY